MDTYFRKTRKFQGDLTGSSLKRPPPSITPPKAAKIPATPKTPPDARLTRPAHPPPVKLKRKPESRSELHKRDDKRHDERESVTVKELFKSVHPQEDQSFIKPIDKSKQPKVATPTSPNKIESGPLKGVSTSLLDLIRAKEAAAKAISPDDIRERELLGIAPEIVRIVPTVFTANKREIMPYDKVVDKCFKGLKSNYTTATIEECIHLLDKVAPEWVSTVKISRGTFMRINRDKYTISQLLATISRYKKDKFSNN